jgi:hypothetical protein
VIEKIRDQNVVIYRHPNPEMRSFLISEEISALRVEHFKKPHLKDLEEISECLGVFGAQIVKEIMLIPGVMEFRIKPKEIMMKKEESSSWEEIEGKVCEILNRAIRRKRIRLVKKL